MSEMTKFDPNSFKDIITGKIRAQFAELIPEEVWKAMVEKELASFTEYQLQKLIQAELTKYAQEQILQYLNSELTNTYCHEQKKVCGSKVLEELVTKHASAIFTQIFTDASQSLLHRITSQFQARY